MLVLILTRCSRNSKLLSLYYIGYSVYCAVLVTILVKISLPCEALLVKQSQSDSVPLLLLVLYLSYRYIRINIRSSVDMEFLFELNIRRKIPYLQVTIDVLLLSFRRLLLFCFVFFLISSIKEARTPHLFFRIDDEDFKIYQTTMKMTKNDSFS